MTDEQDRQKRHTDKTDTQIGQTHRQHRHTDRTDTQAGRRDKEDTQTDRIHKAPRQT